MSAAARGRSFWSLALPPLLPLPHRPPLLPLLHLLSPLTHKRGETGILSRGEVPDGHECVKLGLKLVVEHLVRQLLLPLLLLLLLLLELCPQEVLDRGVRPRRQRREATTPRGEEPRQPRNRPWLPLPAAQSTSDGGAGRIPGGRVFAPRGA